MMCLSGQKIHKNMIEAYTSSSRKGDIIGVKIDLNVGTLEYFRNGESLGIAYENVKGPIAPCISLLKGQKVVLKLPERKNSDIKMLFDKETLAATADEPEEEMKEDSIDIAGNSNDL